MTDRMISPDEEHNSRMQLKSIIRLAGREAAFLSNKLAELDQQIGEIIQHLGKTPDHRLQSADEARQGLEGLARYLLELADSLNTEVICDPLHATRTLVLRSQIHRLLGKSDEPAAATDDIEIWSNQPES